MAANATSRSLSHALCMPSPLAPHGPIAGFAAQMLGQGGVRRGLQAGPGFISCAHSSYQAGGALAAPRPSASAPIERLALSI